MADKNAAVFDFANQIITREVVEKASQSAERLQKEIRREMRRFVENTYKEMIRGRSGLPQFSKIYDRRAPLSLQYYDQKARKGLSTGYYSYSGDLIEELLSRDPIQDLGAPEVRFTPGQGSDLVRIDRAGRPQYAKGSGRRGFAPYSLLRGLHFQIEVDAFPEIRAAEYDKLIVKMTSGVNTMKLSFAEFGTRKQPYRPLVRPFMKWYATKGVFWKIQEILSGRNSL